MTGREAESFNAAFFIDREDGCVQETFIIRQSLTGGSRYGLAGDGTGRPYHQVVADFIPHLVELNRRIMP